MCLCRDKEPSEKCSSQEGAMGLKDSEGEEDGIVFVPCLCYLTMDTTHRKLRPYIPSLVLADWESIADSGALDDTLARSLEQEARVPSCSSSERSGTPSSGPKRRGRGSFLYNKSVLYSDQCGLERDLDDKESTPQGGSGSKGHVNERENNAVTGIQDIHFYLYG